MTIQARAAATALRPAETRPEAAPGPASRSSVRGRLGGVATGVRWPVWWIALGTALLRVPYLNAPMSPDEGGFLVVAQHWHAGGGSLYGPYWVDRPPLLVAVFGVADLLGGFTALRVIGCVVAALTVVGVALAASWAARDATTARRASLWAALVVGALLATPTGGAVMVNGELLAAPFLAFGVALAIRAVRGTPGRIGPGTAAVGAGACAVSAAMVKQNMLDVVVFAVVLGLVAGVRRVAPWTDLARRAALAGAGGLVAFGLVLAGAATRGTTPGALYFAMYPFRLLAAEEMRAQPSTDRMLHLSHMLQLWAASGAPLVVATFLVVVLLRGPGRGRFTFPLAVAVLVTTAYDAFSIWAGGSYWSHYVLQLIVPTGLMAGALLGSVPRTGRTVAALLVAASMVGWGAGFTARVPAAGVTVGQAVADASSPHDTVVSVLGDGVLVRTTGLQVPYRYLWSLPAHVLDHRFARLTTLLDSPSRPSWVVVRGSRPTLRLMRLGPGRALAAHYRAVSRVCGREVYLRDDLSRPVPGTSEQCWLPLVSWDADRATHHWMVTEGAVRWPSMPRAR